MIKIPFLRSKEEKAVAKAFESAEQMLKPRAIGSSALRFPTKKKPAEIGKLVRITPGGRHGWYESNVGLIRKPIKNY